MNSNSVGIIRPPKKAGVSCSKLKMLQIIFCLEYAERVSGANYVKIPCGIGTWNCRR